MENHRAMRQCTVKPNCTYNVHSSTHMPNSVRPLGPSWATAMFQFEGYNSTMISSRNGSQAIPKQIMKKLNWRRALLTLHQRVEQRSPDSLSLEQSLFKNVKP